MAKIELEKLSSNIICFSFFMDVDSIGKSRAEIATQFLLELNPDVQGDYVDENPLQLFEDNPHFFSGFNAVITTSVSER